MGKDYEEQIFDGDVKYHLGWTSKRKSDSGINVYINLAPNPSHLESVGPVVQGITRAKQDKYHKENIEGKIKWAKETKEQTRMYYLKGGTKYDFILIKKLV